MKVHDSQFKQKDLMQLEKFRNVVVVVVVVAVVVVAVFAITGTPS